MEPLEIDLSISVIKIATVGTVGFLLAFFLTPALTSFLYTHKLWRKSVRTEALGGGDVPFFKKFHGEGEVKTPRFGGMLIWVVPPAVAALFFVLSGTGVWWFEKLNFLSRGQTWLPLATLIAASGVGFLDDVLQVIAAPRKKLLKPLWALFGKYVAGGLNLKYRFALVSLIGLTGGLWFFYKLGWNTIHIPGSGDITIGIWYIPLFVLVMLATYSGGVIDGIDGLAGGTFSSIFAAFGIIAFAQGQIDLAAFCFVIAGATLAFLWFNIPPARFYMGETGMMGLTAALTVVAFLTDSVLVLPLIAILLVAETMSVIIQLLSKKLRGGKKVFLAAPIHHHFEALGWPPYKVTMRFWVVGVVAAISGVAVRLLG
jgi:phospho-N-acetylmuramoyl-pentapeptide-transferase